MSNPARDGLRGLAYADPTGLAEATDAVLTGLEEGEGFLTTAGNAGIAILPGPSPKKASKGTRVVANAADEAGDAARKGRKLKSGQKIGGAGEPISPTVKHPTRKRALDAAQAETAKGKTPVKHKANPRTGAPPHYHGVDGNGKLKPKHHDCGN